MVAKKTTKKIAVESSATATAPIAPLEAPVSPLPALLKAPLSAPSTPTIRIDLSNQPTSPRDASIVDLNISISDLNPVQLPETNMENHHDDLAPPVTSTSEATLESEELLHWRK
jgi:hypothetical protein